LVWLAYLACVVIILFAGTKLARYGDAIGEKTGLGGLWIGLVLIAAVTSVPELVTGISSAALVGIPDLAVGTLFGSSIFNLAILALMDIIYRSAPVLSVVRLRHVASAGAGILLINVAAVSIWLGQDISGPAVGWVAVPSIVIFVLYLVAIRQMCRFERKHPSATEDAVLPRYADIPGKRLYFRFALAAIAVIGAGIWLAFVGDEISGTTGLGASFVGSLFLAISTSLPELVVAVAALRLGALDMAVANILGSNMFNIAIIFAVDLSYTRGSILAEASDTHLITAAVAAAMSLVVILGIRFRQKRKTFRVVSWYGLVLLGLYIFGAYMLFVSGFGMD